jgi:hypothetical protein
MSEQNVDNILWSDSLDKYAAEYFGIPLVMPTSYRASEWMQFSEMVKIHIDEYANGQYGDGPNDPVENYTPEECVREVEKYCRRFKNPQSRDGVPLTEEQKMRYRMLDMKKAAHYCGMAYMKLQGG